MREFVHSIIAITVAFVILCHGFMFAVDHVFHDQIHNIDVDGSRGRAIMTASAEATRRDEIRERLYGDDFTVWLGEIIRVIDGDTLEIYHVPNKEVRRVRLWGIDCPEGRQEYGDAARDFVSDRVIGKRVDVVELGSDHYNRVVGVVEFDDVENNLNASLIENGFAWVYPRYCDRPVKEAWETIESQARANKRGLWARDGAIEPWEWKYGNEHKRNKQESH